MDWFESLFVACVYGALVVACALKFGHLCVLVKLDATGLY